MSKKYSLFIILCLFTYLIFIAVKNYETINVTTTDNKKVKTVIIDAGHGGVDAGKVAGGIKEKDINLEIALILDKELKKLGYNTILTRDSDEMPKNKQDEMWKRQVIANGSEGDVFVSIHQNSSNQSGAKGFQIYYFAKSEKSKNLANYIYNSVKKDVNQTTKFEPIENKDFYVLRRTKMPAVLVECGFLSNSGERWLLTTKEYKQKMAIGIANGIDNYFINQ